MIKKINKINDIYFIIFSAILGLVAEISFSSIIYKLNITINEPVINKTLFWFIMIVFIGPYLESILLKSLIEVLKKYIRDKRLIFLLSSAIFGIFHNYNVLYVLFASIIGSIYVFGYLFYNNKKLSSFMIILWTHVIYNGALFIIDYVFNF
jgi:hypothetical protein